MPEGRWLLPPDAVRDPRVPHPDSVYSTRGYYLDDFAADPSEVNVPAGLLNSLDPLFHLVLDVGTRAYRRRRHPLHRRPQGRRRAGQYLSANRQVLRPGAGSTSAAAC